MRICRPINNALPLIHDLAIMGRYMLVLGNQVLMGNSVQIGDYQALLTFGILAKRYDTSNFRQYAGILWENELQIIPPHEASLP